MMPALYSADLRWRLIWFVMLSRGQLAAVRKAVGNLRNDDEGTTTTLHIRGRLDRGFGFRRENLKVKRTILREDDGILGHYRSL